MLFERNRVIDALLPSFDSSYIDKIIQIHFDVPLAERAKLESFLFDHLNELMLSQARIKYFNKERWSNIYNYGISKYLRTLRDVKRLLASFEFSLGIHEARGIPNSNPIDIFALETLRLFEPKGYYALPSAKELLVLPNKFSAVDQSTQKKKELLSWLNSHFNDNEPAKSILCNLFPYVSKYIGDFSSDYEDQHDTTFSQLRVCHPDIFERYFMLRTPTNQVSQDEIEKIIEGTKDHNILINFFELYTHNSNQETFLKILNNYKQIIPKNNANEFIQALMIISETIENGSFLSFRPISSVINTTYWYLMQFNECDRFEILENSFLKNNSTHLMSNILYLSKKKNRTDELFLAENETSKLEKLYMDKCYDLLKNNISLFLAKIHCLHDLYSIKNLDPTNNFLKYLIVNFDNFFLLLSRFNTRIYSTSGDYDRMHYNHFSDFLDMDYLVEISKKVRPTNNREEELLRQFRDMIYRFEQGISDDSD